MPTVAWLTIAPVKGLGLVDREEIQLERSGVLENRRFYLVDENGRKVNQKDLGLIVQVRPDYDAASGRLALRFPDGTLAEAEAVPGERVTTDFYGRPVNGRLVAGPWNEPLSQLAGRPLRLVLTEEAGAGVDRGGGAVSVLSTASLAALAARLGTERLDRRRFRMLIGIDGVAAHEEDEWLGRSVRIGGAVVRPQGNVGRCAVTTQDPDTGVPDLDTLKALRSYRVDGTERIPFGVWGDVVEPGAIRLGDPVSPI